MMRAEDFEEGPGTIDFHDGMPCYRPQSLPPEIEITDNTLSLNGEAQYGLGRLSTLHNDIENENLLIAPFIIREAAMSSQIEGTNVTVSDIIFHDVETPPERSAVDQQDIREAYNYVDAIKQGFNHLDEGNEISLDLICDLHETLLSDVRGEEKKPGELRDVPVYIGSPDGSSENARFIPASPNHISVLMEQLMNYIQRGSYPPLIDIAITHYQFETIHPFRDGNGRIGRLLIMLQMYEADLLSEPYLYLSAYFNRYRQQYLDHLLDVSKNGEWEEWIEFMLNAVAEQARDAYNSGVELKKLRESYHSKFVNHPATRDVIDYIFEAPYLTAPKAIEATGRAKQTVYDSIEKLEDEGIVRSITDSERYRVYEAPGILEIVESP